MGEYADLSMEGAYWMFYELEHFPYPMRKKRKKNPAFYPRKMLPWPKGKKLIPDLCRKNKEDDAWVIYVARPTWDRK